METCINKRLFGSEISFILDDVDENLCNDIIEEAYGEGLRLQNIFNFYDEKSELSLLNRKRKLAVSKELLEVLKMALEMCKKTNGKYDITLGKQFKQRKLGNQVEKVGCSYKDIIISGNKVELLNPDVQVDLGSIAKGYITDKMAEIIINNGIISGLIDSRGDIRIFGEREIEIQHPRDKNKEIGTIKLKDCGVATSGDYKQYDKSFDKSHIINQKDNISVTTVSSRLAEADLYATALFVIPEKEVKSILNKNVKALCINKNLEIKKYNNFEVKNE